MRIINKPGVWASAVVLLTAILTFQAQAQFPWENYYDHSTVSLSFTNPVFSNDSYFDGGGMLANLAISHPVSNRVTLIMNVPYAHYSRRHLFSGDYDIEDLVGNPYLGISLKSNIPHLSTEFGLRLPLANNNQGNALAIGGYADYDQSEAFYADYLSLHYRVSFNLKNEKGLFTQLSLSPCGMVYFGNNDYYDKTEYLVHYGITGGYENQNIRVNAGISGLSLSIDGEAFTDNTTSHQFGVGLSYRLGNFWPGIHLRVPFDQPLSDVIDLAWGLSVSYEVN